MDTPSGLPATHRQPGSRSKRAMILLGLVAVSGARAGERAAARTVRAGISSRSAPGSRPEAAAAGCATETTLCLDAGRFLIDATWTKPDGESGSAHAVSLTTGAGYFWFFEPDNIEVVAKVLDGCAIDGHSWFFAAGMTNLAVRVDVTDLLTNTSRSYSNPEGIVFRPIADTSTFAGCPAAEPGRSTTEAALEAVPSSMPARPTFLRPKQASECVTTEWQLCTGGRFLTFIDISFNGTEGPAHVVQLTPDSGYFWVFDPSNVEMIVKTVDACPINAGNWFFAAGMTTLPVDISVTDTLDGTAAGYGSRPGALFSPVIDTTTFANCPGQPSHYTVFLKSDMASVRCSNAPHGILRYPRYYYSSEIHAVPGDTVTWVWTDPQSGHSVTADDGSWDSGVRYAPFRFTRTFDEPGTFSYHCSVGYSSLHIVTSGNPFDPTRTCSLVPNEVHEGGDVFVAAPTTPTPIPSATPSPTPTPTPAPASLTGTVSERCFVGSGFCAAAQAKVEAQGRATHTDGNGRFDLTGLASGATTVYAHSVDGRSAVAAIDLAPGSNTVTIRVD